MSEDTKTISQDMDETREFHRRYLRAVNSPVRREILRALRDSDGSLESLAAASDLDERTLVWHLSILEHGFCVEKEEREGGAFYKLTQEGLVVDFMDK